ncbi:helix-turn-helix transcriptional regulator [Brevibacillus laterosporus]|uniref:helix-turn-helix transcriptional regulator n=1 Tax=Brevibacillus laterosporus TaxID=1465 RepID=UPI002E1FC7B6|nr:helix-turn-helix transcriptional regulator [Brevibacillus laterosporus]
MKPQLGNIIRAKRKSKGLKQDFLLVSDGIKMNRSHFSDIERGKVVPQLDTLLLLCESLAMSLNEIAAIYTDEQNDKAELVYLAQTLLIEKETAQAKRAAYKVLRINKHAKSFKSRNEYEVKALIIILKASIIEKRKAPKKLIRHLIEKCAIFSRLKFRIILGELYSLSRNESFFHVVHDVFEEAIKVFKFLKDGASLLVKLEFAMSLYFLGKYVEALEWASRAVPYAEFGDSYVQFRLLNLLGNIYTHLKLWEKARYYFIQAAELPDLNPSTTCIAKGNLGRILWKENKPAEARKVWSQLLESDEVDDYMRFNILRNFTFMELKLANYAEAFDLHDRCTKALHQALEKDIQGFKLSYEEASYIKNEGYIQYVKGENIRGAADLLLKSMRMQKDAHTKDDLISTIFLLLEISIEHSDILTVSELREIRKMESQIN